MEKILTPANLQDFEQSASKDKLYQLWTEFIQRAAEGSADFPAYFNTIDPDIPVDPGFATPLWTGFPRTMKRRENNDVVSAASKLDQPIAMGQVDPLYGMAITTVFTEIETGVEYPGPKYRPHDEYLEWVAVKNQDGKLVEALFTCEGPEYWNIMAEDPDLLVNVYRELLGTNEIQRDDLYFEKDVVFHSRNLGGEVKYRKGAYNPFNKWNMAGAVHLTQPANTLGAEIQLAKDATKLYGDGSIVTQDPQLVVCGGYGGINRMSDPTIGAEVNAAVRSGKRVGLRNPIGLYIKEIDESVFSLSDGTYIDNITDYFVALRPKPDLVTDMIVRARFKVPEGVLVAGRQATINDILIDGTPIEYAGQIADKITITLYAQTTDGAPEQELTACSGKACTSPVNPNMVIAIPPDQECPTVPAAGLEHAKGLSLVAFAVQDLIWDRPAESGKVTRASDF